MQSPPSTYRFHLILPELFSTIVYHTWFGKGKNHCVAELQIKLYYSQKYYFNLVCFLIENKQKKNQPRIAAWRQWLQKTARGVYKILNVLNYRQPVKFDT